MQCFQNVLVGVKLEDLDLPTTSELSRPTRAAVNQAMQLAEQTRAQLTFFSAIELSEQSKKLLEQTGKTETSIKIEAQNVLDELVDEAKRQGVAATATLVFGKDWIEIVRQVENEQHDLTIVGTRDLNTTQQFLMGNTGMKLVRNCACPVWVTRPDPPPEDLNILVASDLSDLSAAAVDVAVSGGQFLDAKVHLLHAINYPLEEPCWRTGIQKNELDKYRRSAHEQAEDTLHEQLTHTDYRSLKYGVQLLLMDGPPDRAVMQVIEDHDIDLLIMGTIGRSNTPGILLGNTTERLLTQLPCSVLAIKPSGFQCPIKLDQTT